ncbi:hypothetical protein F2Q70_00040557 [Brassica cretica]|uniref:Uncharacterized protein n=1 Tax=Brassica cretica TaxID=69181 RepID=A0A8S9K111_BRACR|nr:hypothetical protein F2Q70_00040557 [Brassica cretica]
MEEEQDEGDRFRVVEKEWRRVVKARGEGQTSLASVHLLSRLDCCDSGRPGTLSLKQPPLQVSPVDIRFTDLTKFVEIPVGPAPLPLELFRSSTVRLSVFDVEASQLHQKLDGVGVKPNVAEFLCTVKYKPLKPPMDGTTFPAPNVQGSFSENSGVLKYCVEMCISDAIESVSCV